MNTNTFQHVKIAEMIETAGEGFMMYTAASHWGDKDI